MPASVKPGMPSARTHMHSTPPSDHLSSTKEWRAQCLSVGSTRPHALTRTGARVRVPCSQCSRPQIHVTAPTEAACTEAAPTEAPHRGGSPAVAAPPQWQLPRSDISRSGSSPAMAAPPRRNDISRSGGSRIDSARVMGSLAVHCATQTANTHDRRGITSWWPGGGASTRRCLQT